MQIELTDMHGTKSLTNSSYAALDRLIVRQYDGKILSDFIPIQSTITPTEEGSVPSESLNRASASRHLGYRNS